ncbi:MAG: MFS transporter [Pseudomonadota bacterium]|uniref:MFS transporter n=1 Tax=unclassified Phenylobacterium TaxID=2640670 RepID=UPI000700AE72|nr:MULTISPECIES: MFS transporter [unclassified Phenylobacterium]KRB52880.1 sugar phosphate sensor protein [Phenylobacterium sp. Root700]MBT9471068.1 MFS transporter [Phenylobacterium sp.]
MKAILSLFAVGADAAPRTVSSDVDTLYTRHRFRIMMAITLGYGLSYTCRLALGVVKKPLIDQGVFSAADLGLIGSALFYTYAFGKLTNGFLADHANVKRFFAFGLFLSALCNIGMGLSTSVAMAVVFWGLNGWFQSFGAPACVVALAQWFSNRERGRFYGVWSTAHSIGEGLNFLVIGAIVAALGWRFGFFVPATLCIGAAVWCYFWMQDRPQTLGLPAVADWRNDHWQGEKAQVQASAEGPVLATQLSLLKMPAVWILAVSSALTYVTRYAINSWGVLYLQEARGYSLPAAGSLLFVSTLAGVAGAIAFGYISDKYFAARRPPANLLFGLLELVGLGLIFFGPTNNYVLVLGMVLFGLGMTGLVTSLGGLFATDICPKRVAGAALGMIGVFSYLGAAIQEQVSGALIEKGTVMIDGVRHYDFGPAILFWIGASVASLVLATSLWRTKLRD